MDHRPKQPKGTISTSFAKDPMAQEHYVMIGTTTERHSSFRIHIVETFYH